MGTVDVLQVLLHMAVCEHLQQADDEVCALDHKKAVKASHHSWILSRKYTTNVQALRTPIGSGSD